MKPTQTREWMVEKESTLQIFDFQDSERPFENFKKIKTLNGELQTLNDIHLQGRS